MENVYDEPALLAVAGEPRELGFVVLPRLRGRRFNAAVAVAAWGVAGLLSTTVPGLAANRDHVMLCFIFLMAGVLLLFLTIATADLPVVERAAARLEVIVMAMLNST
ncbi:unnamed protein product [Miscanthus lutarioriparius]|uniref:Uncharacterized protein n=1 Tax=Miscanthus lutarioriparius TaxID=422564 RepID=A0A811Q8D9_9POAL|nr:unnamed protein product [Miscanthus lutarioriparius]